MHSVSLPDFVNRWPTPTSTERSGTNPNTGKGEGLSKTAKMFPTPRAGKTTDEDEESWLARHAAGKVATPPLALAARMFPTPTSRDHKDGDAHSCQNVPVNGLLVREVHMLPTPSSGGSWTTPQSQDAKHSGHGASDKHRDLLSVEVVGQMLPTPSSAYAVGSSGGSRGADLRNAVDGSLSPDWVSWLMGLPVGWTSLEPLPREEYVDWFHAQQDGTWWEIERGLPRVATGIKDRVNRLKCLGNGIVPASLALFLRGTT